MGCAWCATVHGTGRRVHVVVDALIEDASTTGSHYLLLDPCTSTTDLKPP